MGAAGSVKSFTDNVNDGQAPSSASTSASPTYLNTINGKRGSPHGNTITSPKHSNQNNKNIRNETIKWSAHNKFESKNLQPENFAGIDLDDLDLNLNLADEIDDQDTIDIAFVNESDEDNGETKNLASKSFGEYRNNQIHFSLSCRCLHFHRRSCNKAPSATFSSLKFYYQPKYLGTSFKWGI